MWTFYERLMLLKEPGETLTAFLKRAGMCWSTFSRARKTGKEPNMRPDRSWQVGHNLGVNPWALFRKYRPQSVPTGYFDPETRTCHLFPVA